MIVVNFSHPLSEEQIGQIEQITGQPVKKVLEIHSQIDPQESLEDQVLRMVDQVQLSAEEWQNAPILINPPSLNFTALMLVGDLHGRMGFFPAFLRLRPVKGALPPRFEVAEVLDLHSIREKARLRRSERRGG
jgi:hypothetical protein